MDFSELKKKEKHPRADSRNPWMGLEGKICEKPAYWCRRHEVWLSEEDVERKHCRARLTADMMMTRPCTCLEKKTENPILKTRGA